MGYPTLLDSDSNPDPIIIPNVNSSGAIVDGEFGVLTSSGVVDFQDDYQILLPYDYATASVQFIITVLGAPHFIEVNDGFGNAAVSYDLDAPDTTEGQVWSETAQLYLSEWAGYTSSSTPSQFNLGAAEFSTGADGHRVSSLSLHLETGIDWYFAPGGGPYPDHTINYRIVVTPTSTRTPSYLAADATNPLKDGDIQFVASGSEIRFYLITDPQPTAAAHSLISVFLFGKPEAVALTYTSSGPGAGRFLYNGGVLATGKRVGVPDLSKLTFEPGAPGTSVTFAFDDGSGDVQTGVLSAKAQHIASASDTDVGVGEDAIVVAVTANQTLHGAAGDVLVASDAGLDTLIGSGGNTLYYESANAFDITVGNNTFYGSGGNDTVIFNGNISNYAVTKGTDGTITVSDGILNDTLKNIRFLEFGDVTLDSNGIACFVSGSRILTPCGEVPVQHLSPGDQVLTQRPDGALEPAAITWIGHRRIDLDRQRYPELVTPVRIARNAFAEGVPTRDTYLSPDHAVFVDGRLIQMKNLVNGGSIAADPRRRHVDYFHVELERHAILLADGLPSESYLDAGNRAFFANHPSTSLHPNPEPTCWPEEAVAPLTTDPGIIETIWSRLADRSAALGIATPQLGTARPPCIPRLVAEGRIIRPIRVGPGAFSFAIPAHARTVRLISDFHVPTDARPWDDDRRRLGVCVSRLAMRSGTELRDLPLDDPSLVAGWWSIERGDGAMWRWTDGDAFLQLDPGTTALDLRVRIAGCRPAVVPHSTWSRDRPTLAA